MAATSARLTLARAEAEVRIISITCAVALALLSVNSDLWLGLQNGAWNLLDIDADIRVGSGIFTLLVFGMLAWNNWKEFGDESTSLDERALRVHWTVFVPETGLLRRILSTAAATTAAAAQSPKPELISPQVKASVDKAVAGPSAAEISRLHRG